MTAKTSSSPYHHMSVTLLPSSAREAWTNADAMEFWFEGMRLDVVPFKYTVLFELDPDSLGEYVAAN
jgi:hypothetical protein